MRRTTSVEDVTNKEYNIQTLPNDIGVIMMPESEYVSLSKEGGIEELKQQFKQQNAKCKRMHTTNKTKKEHQNVPETKNMTSIETDEVHPKRTKLQDRPTPPTKHRWVKNPQLPIELNEMISIPQNSLHIHTMNQNERNDDSSYHYRLSTSQKKQLRD